MTKETIRNEAAEADVQEPRRLNMEEKRKLEKLLLGDIDSAVARYNAQAQEARRSLIEKLEKNPPTEVTKLFGSYTAAKKAQKDAEVKLDKRGWDIAYDGTLAVNTYGSITPEVAAFKSEKTRQSLQTLKRSYVIKLFADHADTQSLFAALAKDLDTLIR